MARAINLKTDEEMQDFAREVGFDPENVDEAPDRPDEFEDHPISVENAGDVMKVLALVGHIEDEVEKEEEALESELETVREFRENRIQKKKDSIDYLTAPLVKFIEEWGENYNGPGGHAGFHTVTTTDWKATADELAAFALEHGLKVKVQIKAELTRHTLRRIKGLLRSQGIENPSEVLDVTAYKSSIKDHMKEKGLHKAEYSESGEAVDGNPLYELEKRKDFRVKPE